MHALPYVPKVAINMVGWILMGTGSFNPLMQCSYQESGNWMHMGGSAGRNYMHVN